MRVSSLGSTQNKAMSSQRLIATKALNPRDTRQRTSPHSRRRANCSATRFHVVIVVAMAITRNSERGFRHTPSAAWRCRAFAACSRHSSSHCGCGRRDFWRQSSALAGHFGGGLQRVQLLLRLVAFTLRLGVGLLLLVQLLPQFLIVRLAVEPAFGFVRFALEALHEFVCLLPFAAAEAVGLALHPLRLYSPLRWLFSAMVLVGRVAVNLARPS